MHDECHLVSAVMITGKDEGRSFMAKQAIDCFLVQDWPHRELIILNTGKTSLWDKTHVLPSGVTVKEIRLEDAAVPLGELRTIASSYASGKWIAQWDDDDLYAPHRISLQMKHGMGGHAVLLRSQIRWNRQSNFAFAMKWPGPHGIPGTMLYSTEMPSRKRFRPLRRHEDTWFLKDHFPGKVITIDNTEPADVACYIRTWHGLNTWPESHVMGTLHDKYDPQNPWQLDMPPEVIPFFRRLVDRYVTMERPPGFVVRETGRFSSEHPNLSVAETKAQNQGELDAGSFKQG